MRKYQLIKYTDVVEGESGAWAVLAANEQNIFLKLEDNSTARDICQELKARGALDTADMRKISITDLHSDIIEIKEKKTSRPICRLERRKYV